MDGNDLTRQAGALTDVRLAGPAAVGWNCPQYLSPDAPVPDAIIGNS